MYLFIVTDWSKLKKNYVSSSLLNLTSKLFNQALTRVLWVVLSRSLHVKALEFVAYVVRVWDYTT